MSEVHLDAASIEAIAERVAELLRGDPPAADRLLDANEVAARLGVSRDFVYGRAAELGAIRLGDGDRAALRFRAENVEKALSARSAGERSQPPESPTAERKPGHRRSGSEGSSARLLPVVRTR